MHRSNSTHPRIEFSGTESVPDSGGTGLCLAFAAGLMLFFRLRKQKAWTS
jgi:hypothetical protein